MKLFYFRKKQKMNHVNTNRINNYIYRYRIKDTKENFNKIGEVITQREFDVYCKILYMIDNAVKICLKEHRELLEDLTKSFLTKKN